MRAFAVKLQYLLAMSRLHRISRQLSVAVLTAGFFALAAVAPVIAAAAPAGDLIQQPAGSKLFKNGTGFMWGTSEGSFVIVRTEDNGKTWSKLDLAGVSIDLNALSIAPGGRPSPVFAHFEDPDHGWVVWSENDSVLRIANTTDSGASWQEALSLQTDTVLNRQAFPGPGRACLLAEMPEGMMHTTMVIVATDDNGVTWTSSELQGDGVTDWTFRSATDGFLLIFNPGGDNILFYRTTDGGKSWQSVDLPLPPKAEGVAGVFGGKIAFSGPKRLDGRLTVRILQSGWVNLTYRTTDGGKTWTYSK